MGDPTALPGRKYAPLLADWQALVDLPATSRGRCYDESAGKMRLEGRDYLVADGDVIRFRFNV